MYLFSVYLTNRTFEKAEKIKETFNDITIQKWGDIPEFDIVVNATSVGLNNESFDLRLNKVGNNTYLPLKYHKHCTRYTTTE